MIVCYSPRVIFALSAFMLAFALPNWAGDAKSALELLPRWKKGDKRRFELTEFNERVRGEKVLRATARSQIDVEVLQATRRGFVVRWLKGEIKLDDAMLADNPIVQSMAKLIKDVPVLFEIDANGSFDGIRNWKELREISAKALDAALEGLPKGTFTEAQIKTVRESMAALMDSKENVEAEWSRDAILLLMVLGKTYEAGTTLIYEGELPNVFGGDPFASRLLLSLESLDKKTGQAVINWKQTIDPKSAARTLEKSLREFTKRLGKPLPEGDVLKHLNIEDTGKATVDVVSGWIERSTYTRSVRSFDNSHRQTVTIVRKPD